MIRMAEVNDAAACTDIYNWYIVHSMATFETETISVSAFEKRIRTVSSRYPWIVYEDQGTVLGYAYLDVYNPRQAYDWTADLSIYINHECRHHGIGKQLMQTILELGRQDGYRTVMSLVTGGNSPSMAMHDAFGFAKEAELKNLGYKNGKWQDLLLYRKELQEYPDGTTPVIRNLPVKE